jgi:hypothetical protein
MNVKYANCVITVVQYLKLELVITVSIVPRAPDIVTIIVFVAIVLDL